MDLLEILMEIEEEFAIDINDNMAENIQTVGDAITAAQTAKTASL